MYDDGTFATGIKNKLQRSGIIYFNINYDDIIEQPERNRDFTLCRIIRIDFGCCFYTKATQAQNGDGYIF